MKTAKACSGARFNPYLRGVIYGLFLAGMTYQEIADEVEKPDGSNPCQQSIATVVAQATERGGIMWDGASLASKAGRPRETSTALDKKIVKLVFKHRGKAVVTATSGE